MGQPPLGREPSDEQFVNLAFPKGMPITTETLFAPKIPDEDVMSVYEWLSDLSGIRLAQLVNKCGRLTQRAKGSGIEELGLRFLGLRPSPYESKMQGRFLMYSSGSKGRALAFLLLYSLLGQDSYLSLCWLLKQQSN